MEQMYSSANTSINSTKLPKIFGALTAGIGKVLDYGCGKHISHTRAKVEDLGYLYSAYDKYNQPDSLPVEPQDIILCANVLNVVAEKEVRTQIYTEVLSLLKDNGKAYFQIYEGYKSGIGKATKNDCYQNNQQVQFYINELAQAGITSKKQAGFIVIQK